MEKYYIISYLGSTYGSGSYNTSTYNGASQTQTGSGTGATSGAAGSTGVLANTGFDVLAAVTFACFLLFTALIVRFWKRKPTSSATK